MDAHAPPADGGTQRNLIRQSPCAAAERPADDLYEGERHILMELIQNAEDARARDRLRLGKHGFK